MPDMRAKKIMTTWMPQQKCLVVNLDKMAGLCERRSWEDEEVYQQEEGCQGSRQLEEDSGGGQDPQRVVAPSVVTAGYHGSNILERFNWNYLKSVFDTIYGILAILQANCTTFGRRYFRKH
ncbi:uncharacterized protein LOC133521961 isoform X2 [Cydia pomonella]|uniref:uncharacterized protein LOC133521961 isoform X2 n=1 Tax=Cydia pomonella TaxID=82600 RepID=UPI002ADE6A28|nr:uncharacterized protein LOC133521961 isoform X2 [Cydia pomonella]